MYLSVIGESTEQLGEARLHRRVAHEGAHRSDEVRPPGAPQIGREPPARLADAEALLQQAGDGVAQAAADYRAAMEAGSDLPEVRANLAALLRERNP